MQANETHKYISRGSARDAAIEAGLAPGEDVHLCRLNVSGAMRWGWVSSELAYADEAAKVAEAEFGPMETDDQSADAIMARNAERIGEPDIVIATLPDTGGVLIVEGRPIEATEAADAELYLRLPADQAQDIARAVAKKFKLDVRLTNAAGETVLSVYARKPKPEKPARPAPMGLQVDEYDRPVRPEITQEKWVKTCAGHFDRIEAIAGNATKLLDYEDSINPGDTYRTIVWRYAKNHRLYATKYGRSPFAPEATSEGWDGAAANDTGGMSAAAD